MAFLIGVEGNSHFTPSTLFCAVFHLMHSRWVHWNGMDISAPSLHLQRDFSMDQLQHNMILVGQRVQITSTHVFSWDIPTPTSQLSLFIKAGFMNLPLKIWSAFPMHQLYFLIHIENVLWQCNMYSRLFLLVVKSRLSLKTYGVLHICTSPAKPKEATGNKCKQTSRRVDTSCF